MTPESAAPDDTGKPQVPKPPLRFLTCGSVDDGKSTLIGRLLFDAQAVKSDTLVALDRASATYSTTGGRDLALLVDGLQAEREQGITIDVAYRYFATKRRSFIVADTPGHEQYTRNMATGASNCDLAVLLVDATKGLQRQTFRHLVIATMLGIRHVVLAINKMDQVGFDQALFEKLTNDFRQQCARLGDVLVTAVPMSALDGDNVCVRSLRMPWYEGPTLLSHLESVDVERERPQIGMRLPVQWVCRPHANFRGYAGTLIGDKVTVGDDVVSVASGIGTQVSKLWSAGHSVASAGAGEAVMIALADEIDLSRGEVLSGTQSPAVAADQYAADLIWFGDQPMRPGRIYRLQAGPQSSTVQIGRIKYMLDIETLKQLPCRELQKNEIARCNVALSRPIVLEPYDECRELGGFIIVDRVTNDTVGAGLIRHALHRSSNIRWQDLKVNKGQRAALKGQRPCCLWFTGLSGAGKSTIANLVEARLASSHYHTYLLDGDNVRHGLNRDLGFTESDRVENIRRLTEVARLMVDAGLITIVAAISPFRVDRDAARQRFESLEFIEVFVDTPLAVCESRDTKGLYHKARAGEIGNFTGISSPYEPPEASEIVLAAGGSKSAESLADEVIQALVRRGIIT